MFAPTQLKRTAADKTPALRKQRRMLPTLGHHHGSVSGDGVVTTRSSRVRQPSQKVLKMQLKDSTKDEYGAEDHQPIKNSTPTSNKNESSPQTGRKIWKNFRFSTAPVASPTKTTSFLMRKNATEVGRRIRNSLGQLRYVAPRFAGPTAKKIEAVVPVKMDSNKSLGASIDSLLHVVGEEWKQADAQKLLSSKESLSILKIQSLARTWLVSKSLQEEGDAAKKIQKTWRNFINRIDFLIKDHAREFLIEEIEDKTIQVSDEEKSKSRKERLAIISSEIRAYAIHLEYETRKRCAMEIQKHVRGNQCRRELALKNRSAIIIQARARGYACRDELELANVSAREIQKVYRGHSCSTGFAMLLIGVIKIQMLGRQYLAHRQLESLKTEKQYRDEQAALIQRTFKKYVHKKQLEREAQLKLMLKSATCLLIGVMCYNSTDPLFLLH